MINYFCKLTAASRGLRAICTSFMFYLLLSSQPLDCHFFSETCQIQVHANDVMIP